jgi:hypothetical protein
MEDLGPAFYTLPDPLLKKDIAVKRTDSIIKNSQGKILQCSHFEPVDNK